MRRLLPIAALLLGVLWPLEASAAEPEAAPQPEPVEAPTGEPTDEEPTDEEPTDEEPTDVDKDGPVFRARHSDPCIGKTIRSVALKGCEDRRCRQQGGGEHFLSLTDLERGDTLTDRARDLAVERLEQTGFFREVVLRCRQLPGGAMLVFHTAMNTFVRKVSLEGNEAFAAKEIRKRVFLRSGTILNVAPGLEAESETVRRQIDSIKRFYRREGLEDVEVRLEARRVERTTVDVVVHIDEGEMSRIKAIEIDWQKAERPRGAPLRCPTVAPRRIRRLVGLGVGDVVTSRERRRIRRRLETFFQSIGFARPDVEVEASGDPLTLSVVIQTDRCWLVRLWQRDTPALAETRTEPAIRFRDPLGAARDSLSEADWERQALEPWRESLPFGASGVFDRGEAERGVDAIHQALQDRGYLFADVELEHRAAPRSEEGWGPVGGTIDYLITLNYERRVQGVILRGRRSFPESEVLEVLDTKVWDALGTGGYVSVDRVLFDLIKLRRFYNERGFYDFRFLLEGLKEDSDPVRSVEDKGAWIIWEYTFQDRGFRVRKRKSEMVVYVETPYEEGPRTRIGYLSFHGNEAMDDATVQRLLKLKGGQPFGTWYLDEGMKAVKRWYHKRGYHKATVTALCDAEDSPPAGGDCQQVRSRKVDVAIAISEGPRSTVGEIYYRGHFKTDPEVLLRDLPPEGSPYVDSEIAEVTGKLRNLGVFNAVTIDRIGLEESPPRQDVGLVVSVEEAETRFVDLYAGFRTIDRDSDRDKRAPPLVGSLVGQAIASGDRQTSGLGRPLSLSLPDVLLSARAEYNDRHWLGRGYRLSLPIDVGTSTTEPLRLASLVPSLDVPRFLDSNVNLRFELLAEIDRVNEQLDRTEIGTGVSLSVPLIARMPLSVGARASLICFDSAETDCSKLDSLQPQYTPSLTWRWDTQDNPLNPRRGIALAAGLKYILAVDREKLEDKGVAELVDFVKWELSAEFAREVMGGPIIAAFIHYGAAVADKDEGKTVLLPANERFTLGGSNGMRGFADHAIGRYDVEGVLEPDILDYREDGGGNVVINGSAELRIPLLEDLGVWSAAFVDFGGLAMTHDELHSTSIRTSAGGGLRWLLGDQIPIRVDGAVVLDSLGEPRCIEYVVDPDPESLTGVRCTQKEDGFAFHVELLYPF